jgi:electron transfer flavoprotein beta subunit
VLKIIACFKWVIDEADIKVDKGSRRLILDRVSYRISAYDRNAIEEAARLQEQHGGSVAAVTVAHPSAKPCLKDALSRGPDKAYFIHDPSFADLEPSQTASLLAAAIKSRIAFDLIICGEGSSDLYAQQVGPALAERLGIPCATCVSKLAYVESERLVIADRKLEDGIETVSLPLPALVTIRPDINTPRIPTLKQVLGAAKKPVESITLEALGQTYAPCLRALDTLGATMDRRRLKFGPEPEGIRSVIGALLKEGVIA